MFLVKMAALLVTFRLAKPTTDPNYLGVISVIKQYSFTMLGEGSVAVETNESPTQLFAKFKPYVNSKDVLLITTLNKPHYGLHKPTVLQWIEQNAKTGMSA